MWILFAFGSAFFAGITAILANAEYEKPTQTQQPLSEQL